MVSELERNIQIESIQNFNDDVIEARGRIKYYGKWIEFSAFWYIDGMFSLYEELSTGSLEWIPSKRLERALKRKMVRILMQKKLRVPFWANRAVRLNVRRKRR